MNTRYIGADRGRLATFAALVVISSAGCGGPALHQASQPNGPPKPVVVTESPEGDRPRAEAIERAVAYARTKYHAKLDYSHAEAYYGGRLPHGIRLPANVPRPVPGTWFVSLRPLVPETISIETIEAIEGPSSPDQAQLAGREAALLARQFRVSARGEVKEDRPLLGMPKLDSAGDPSLR